MRPTEQDGHILYDGPDGPSVVEEDAILTNSQHLVSDLLDGDLTDIDRISALVRARLPRDHTVALLQLMDTVKTLCLTLDAALSIMGKHGDEVRRGLAHGLRDHHQDTDDEEDVSMTS